eukprot:GFYU01007450.1.p1 GENE.GFYU01007450.1~~GFYU01007450.1.p1  ORF type:complete len:438 (-),score=89.24 GFYU01007450.1:94-1338(-)
MANVDILFTNCLLVDGTGADPLPNAHVHVVGNKIRAVSTTAITPADTTTVIDCKGKVVMPGLMDLHAHPTLTLPLSELMSGRPNFPPPFIHTLQTRDALAKTLNAGFTTIRDACGGTKAMKQAINTRMIPGPRTYISCRMISITGGHGDGLCIPGQHGVAHEFGLVVDGSDNCRKACRQVMKEGADWIKVASGGGVSSQDDDVNSTQFTKDELSAIVDEAATKNKKVMAHAHSDAAIKHAIRCGVGSIEHCTLATPETIQDMINHGVAAVPTTAVMFDLYEKSSSLPPPVREKMLEVHVQSEKCLRETFKRFGELTIGSGSDSLHEGMHGRNGMELVHKVTLGLTPMQSIMSATSVNAKILGIQDTLGSVEVGKLADLIVVNGNPLEDIKIIGDSENVLLVMKDGEIVKNTLAK